MKYLRMKLINYIGIYNGMRLNEIEIDFSKMKNKVVMIKGDNGSGKSTIYNSLHPFPDSNDNFIEGLPAEKQIDLLHEDLVYRIRILHGINTRGVRETTKVFMMKGNIYSDEFSELNENGNVGSFKEVLFSELNLDPNFLALTALSGGNRGLADMKPADRKKYVNSIIKELSEFNDIHKVLNKRSSTFKSMINNITSKINTIGSHEQISSTLKSVENRLNNLMSDKDKCIEEISEYKGTVKVLDPTGENVKIYDKLYSELGILENTKKDLLMRKDNLTKQINLDYNKSITEVFNMTKDKYTECTTNIQIIENSIQTILNDKEKQSKEIEELNMKLYSYTSDMNYETLIEQRERCIKDIAIYSEELNKRNTHNLLTLEEYDIILKLINDINTSIYNIKDNYDITMLNIDCNTKYDESTILNLTDKLLIFKQKVMYFESQLAVLDKLNLRPSQCDIDECPFIRDAVEAFNENPEEQLIVYRKLIEETEQEISAQKFKDVLYKEHLKLKNDINIIVRTVNNYRDLLNKAGIIISEDMIIDAINTSYIFYNEINTINQYKETANINILYNKLSEELNLLNADYKIYLNQKDLIDYMMQSLTKLQEELTEIINNLDETNNKLLYYKQEQLASKQVLDILTDILALVSEINEIQNNIDNTNSSLYALHTNIDKIKEYMAKIVSRDRDMGHINNQITPLLKDRDTLAYNLRMLEEYTVELQHFKDKYVKIEVLKKHCSPTTGIQLIFIELYMNSTLSLANDMLAMLFEGEYVLKNFTINESEFKIPCVGSGLGNDDISSMSTGQICMISMILSFSLLQQSSTKYNILKLDEIDGGLDTGNRRIFVDLLYKLMSILNVEQTIMISHNNEIPMDEVDLIILRTQDTSYSNHNNIIYKF